MSDDTTQDNGSDFNAKDAKKLGKKIKKWLKRLSLIYPAAAFHATVRVPRTNIAIIGPPGSGKTELLLAISKLYENGGYVSERVDILNQKGNKKASPQLAYGPIKGSPANDPNAEYLITDDLFINNLPGEFFLARKGAEKIDRRLIKKLKRYDRVVIVVNPYRVNSIAKQAMYAKMDYQITNNSDMDLLTAFRRSAEMLFDIGSDDFNDFLKRKMDDFVDTLIPTEQQIERKQKDVEHQTALNNETDSSKRNTLQEKYNKELELEAMETASVVLEETKALFDGCKIDTAKCRFSGGNNSEKATHILSELIKKAVNEHLFFINSIKKITQSLGHTMIVLTHHDQSVSTGIATDDVQAVYKEIDHDALRMADDRIWLNSVWYDWVDNGPRVVRDHNTAVSDTIIGRIRSVVDAGKIQRKPVLRYVLTALLLLAPIAFFSVSKESNLLDGYFSQGLELTSFQRSEYDEHH